MLGLRKLLPWPSFQFYNLKQGQHQLYLFVVKSLNFGSVNTFTWFLSTLCCLELCFMTKKWLPVSWDLMILTCFWGVWPQCSYAFFDILIYRDQTWYRVFFFFFGNFLLIQQITLFDEESQNESQTQTDVWSYTIITQLHQNQNFSIR